MSQQTYVPPPSYNMAGKYEPHPNQSRGQGHVQAPQPDQGFAYGQEYEEPKEEAYATRVSPDDSDDIFVDKSFSNKAIRQGFIRKVYLILAAQLVVTFGIVVIFTFVDSIKDFIQTPPQGSYMYYSAYGVFLVTYITLVCCPGVRRQYPGNFICLSVFTLAFSYMVGTISSYYTTNSVLVAAGITTLVCLSISIFAIQTKIDFTLCSGLLFALMMVLILFGFSCIIVYMTAGYNKILDCVWGGLAALVFSLFLIYDTQMIVGGRKHELDPEEYVYGALQLYIDVVYLFLIILACFGKSN